MDDLLKVFKPEDFELLPEPDPNNSTIHERLSVNIANLYTTHMEVFEANTRQLELIDKHLDRIVDNNNSTPSENEMNLLWLKECTYVLTFRFIPFFENWDSTEFFSKLKINALDEVNEVIEKAKHAIDIIHNRPKTESRRGLKTNLTDTQKEQLHKKMEIAGDLIGELDVFKSMLSDEDSNIVGFIIWKGTPLELGLFFKSVNKGKLTHPQKQKLIIDKWIRDENDNKIVASWQKGGTDKNNPKLTRIENLYGIV